jgi:hypothetical protein
VPISVTNESPEFDGEWLEKKNSETVKARKEINKINKENAKNKNKLSK